MASVEDAITRLAGSIDRLASIIRIAAMPDPTVEIPDGLTLAELNLSPRASFSLDHAGIHTVEDLCKQGEVDLLALKNFGKTCLREVKQKLDSFGLRLTGREVM